MGVQVIHLIAFEPAAEHAGLGEVDEVMEDSAFTGPAESEDVSEGVEETTGARASIAKEVEDEGERTDAEHGAGACFLGQVVGVDERLVETARGETEHGHAELFEGVDLGADPGDAGDRIGVDEIGDFHGGFELG
jgi:hypothetical protein